MFKLFGGLRGVLYTQLFQPVLRAGGRLRRDMFYGRCRSAARAYLKSGRWRDGLCDRGGSPNDGELVSGFGG